MHFVTKRLQHLPRDLPYRVIVFNEQDRFRAPAQLRCSLPWGCRLLRWQDGRQKDLESRALPNPARHLHPSLVLLHNAIHRRQPQTRALARFLRGEERLKYALQMFRGNTRAGVAHA